MAEAQGLLGAGFVVSDTRERLLEHMAELARRETETVAINGGDGTVSHVLTAIAATFPHDRLPRIAVLPSGNTNLIANDVGFGQRGLPALARLRDDLGVFREEVRSPIEVSWPNGAHHSVLGMFHGSTGFARAIEIAHDPTVLKYAPHELAVGVTMLGAFGGLLLHRRTRETWLAGDRYEVAARGEPPKADRSFLFLATGLSRLSHGVWPFWREAGDPAEGVRFLNIHDRPERVAAGIWSLMRGRAPGWMRASDDYESGCVERLSICGEVGFVMDGEVYEGRETVLSRGPRFRFLCP